MTKLEIFQNALAAYKNADNEAEREQILQNALAEFRTTKSSAEETATAFAIMMEVVRGMIVKAGYDLEKAKAIPNADLEELNELGSKFSETLESLQVQLLALQKKAAEQSDSEEGGAK
jgi:flagellar hook-basal body complex protein FliE